MNTFSRGKRKQQKD